MRAMTTTTPTQARTRRPFHITPDQLRRFRAAAARRGLPDPLPGKSGTGQRATRGALSPGWQRIADILFQAHGGDEEAERDLLSLRDRLYHKTNKHRDFVDTPEAREHGEDSCIIWMRGSLGIGVGGTVLSPRQVAYALLKGRVPDETNFNLTSTCGDKNCINPHHATRRRA